MESENFRYFMELTLHPLGLLIAVGLVHALVLEFNSMRNIYANMMKGTVDWRGIFEALRSRLEYLLGGVVVTMGAYIITTVLYRQFPETLLTNPGVNFLATPQNQATGFVLAVAMFVLCGYSLIVSAGNRWFVGLAKIFAVLGVLIIFALTAGVYLPLWPTP